MRILLVQRSLDPPGGGNAVAAWIVHALSQDHDVATLTTSAWTPARTNAFYGTAIAEERVARHVIPRPWSWLSRLPEERGTRLRMCAVLRYARDRAGDYDVLITADNYAAFPKPGIQYLHYPAAINPAPARFPAIVNAYFAFCDWLVGIPWTAAHRNLTLANSQWTAQRLERIRGVKVGYVLYPPVIDPGAGDPFDKRTDTFLCIGRFHGSKRFERSIAIVRRLRSTSMPHARLIIVGSAVDTEYTRRLRALIERDRDWIEIREDLSRTELNVLMGQCRFGLQAMEDEHFGMATAEMARAGCLVFTHRSGGSIEVVNSETRLMWSGEDEAVAKISALAADPRACAGTQARLRAHAERFSAEQFVEQMRALVSG